MPADGGEPVVLAAGATSTPAPGSAPTAAGWPGWSGTTRTCPGTGPSCGWPRSAGDALAGDPVTVAGGPEESVFQPEWSPDGVLHLVSDRTGWWNLYRVGPGGGPGGAGPGRGGVRPPPVGLRHGDLRVPARRPDRLHPRPRPHAAPRHPGAGRHPDRPGAAVHLLLPAAPAGGRRPGRLHRRQPDRRPGGGPDRPRRRRRRGAPVQRGRGARPRLPDRPRADRVPHRGRPHRPRPLLPAGQPRRPGPGGGAAAAGGGQPRRPHLRGHQRPARQLPVLHQPRHRRGRRRLRRLHRLRPRLPPAPGRPVGDRRRRRLRRRRPPPGRTRRRRPGPPGHPRRQRRRLHHPVRPHLPRRLRRRGQLLRGGRRGRPGPRHPQVRVPLPGPPDRPLAGGRGRCTGSGRRSTTPTACPAR